MLFLLVSWPLHYIISVCVCVLTLSRSFYVNIFFAEAQNRGEINIKEQAKVNQNENTREAF